MWRREIRTGCNHIMNQEEKLLQDVSVIAHRLKELHNDEGTEKLFLRNGSLAKPCVYKYVC